MLTGVYAARNVTGERHDIWAVNTEKEYLEEGESVTVGHGDRLVPVPVSVGEPVEELDDSVIEDAFARLDPLALGVAVGLVAAVGLMFATVILLIKGGPHVGPNLSLLGHYLPQYDETWTGMTLGGVEAGLAGFGLGYLGAWLRNRGLQTYARFVKWRGESEERRHLLDKM